mmetsp:Transcript_9696/g.14287  ORF Transcript_9696/g.14287 Transcript_9696/m.14287 type:complete len:235 (-) Transcript_9696:3035-3739(-)
MKCQFIFWSDSPLCLGKLRLQLRNGLLQLARFDAQQLVALANDIELRFGFFQLDIESRHVRLSGLPASSLGNIKLCTSLIKTSFRNLSGCPLAICCTLGRFQLSSVHITLRSEEAHNFPILCNRFSENPNLPFVPHFGGTAVDLFRLRLLDLLTKRCKLSVQLVIVLAGLLDPLLQFSNGAFEPGLLICQGLLVAFYLSLSHLHFMNGGLAKAISFARGFAGCAKFSTCGSMQV